MGGTATGRDGGLATGPQARESEPEHAGDSIGLPNVPAPRSSQERQLVVPNYTPLFHAQNDARYLRRSLIREYQSKYSCRLAVMIDVMQPESVPYFCELLHDAAIGEDLHVFLRSPGGDGQVAVRLVRAAQSACKNLVVVVPDIAKSAATIFALGAHRIVMGPPSDLGPIDPQVLVGSRGYVSAKEIISAVDRALTDISSRPPTYPLYAALLGTGNVDATTYEFAKSALGDTAEIAKQAIGSNPDRSQAEAEELFKQVEAALITSSQLHSAVVGPAEAQQVGLPVVELGLSSEWWQDVWRIWTRYFTLGPHDFMSIYESEHASQVMHHEPPSSQE